MKTCTRCREEKPLEAFYRSGWNCDHTRRFGDGYRQPCKACALAMETEMRATWPEQKLSQWKKSQQVKARRWDAKNPSGRRASWANLHARRLGSKDRVTAEEVAAAWKKWNGKCWVCGFAADQLDHFRPINKKAGGANTADNIRPVCGECNQKRSHKWHGEETAMKEARLLRQIKRLLNQEPRTLDGLVGHSGSKGA